MLTGKSLSLFRKNLLVWFTRFQRDLPWRLNKDPYRIWLSEVMLQQTRVVAAIPYYERFLARFPTISALAEAPQEDVLRLWSGLGYYSRARNLQKAAQQIVANHGGVFPSAAEAVLALPGIGSYTAAAILSIACNQRFAVLDGNVARVLARLGAIQGDLRSGTQWQELQESANKLLDTRRPGDWNQAMMELGATICTPRAPQCLLCPIQASCEARKRGLMNSIPAKRKKRATESIILAALVFLDPKGHTLLLAPPRSNPKTGANSDVPALFSRMWHFPTIAVKNDAIHELELFIAATFIKGKSAKNAKLEPLKKVRHAVTYRSITLLPFRVRVAKLPRLPGARSILLEEISSLPISNLTRKVSQTALA
jgi:A/G-specific adenine glycosylase